MLAIQCSKTFHCSKRTLVTQCLLLYMILLNFPVFNEAFQRKLSYKVNPSCDPAHCFPEKNKPAINLVHIEAEGTNDTVHYIWSTYRLPTVLVARTAINVSLSVDWEKLEKLEYPSFLFSEVPLQSMGIIISELYQFDDDGDVVDMNRAKSITPLNLTDFSWNDIGNSTKFSESFISAFPQSSSEGSVFQSNGTFRIQFSASASAKSSNAYPHLWFNGISCQLRTMLQNLVPATKKSRFAAEMYSFSSSFKNENWTEDSTVSINDEYSPGVFKVQHLYSNSLAAPDSKSFVMWKPVAYIGEKPTVANSSDATSSPYRYGSIIPPDSIAITFYEENDPVAVLGWNVTFGTSGDGFYEKTRFTSWSVMFGLGDPVLDKMSLLAIVVISIGLGAPLLMMVIGGGYIGYKRLKKTPDDDILLDR